MKIARRRWFGAAAAVVAAGTATSHASAAGLTFEIYADARKEHRWRLKASNGQVIATSGQGYKAKADCKRAIESIQSGAATAKVEEVAAETK